MQRLGRRGWGGGAGEEGAGTEARESKTALTCVRSSLLWE